MPCPPRGGALQPGQRSARAGEPPEREIDVLRRALALLRERLPPGWSASITEEAAITDRRVDALVELAAPDQAKAVFIVEAKRSVVTRDLPAMLQQVRSHVDRIPGSVPVLAARYLAPSARAWLEERGISYVDTTGNLRIATERPALFLRDVGADHDPWRGAGRPRGTLQGPAAARVARALVDFAAPVSVPELVRRSGASTGATYRVIEFLEREALIERTPRGPVEIVQWRRLIERWSEDYGFQRSNTVSAYLHPRGLSAVLDGLATAHGLRYAITGSLAAQRLAAHAPPRLAMIYVHDPEQAASRLGLRAVDTGANVLLAAGDYDVVFDRLVEAANLKFTAPSQTAVDLLTGPGRNPAEAVALLDWMETDERRWRR